MNVDSQLTEEINQLTPENMKYMCKLICLMRFCPEFNEALKQVIPTDCATVSPEQLAETNALMNKWLYKEGYAGLLRAELASVGVQA